MTTPLTIGALRRAYLAGSATPSQTLPDLARRFTDPDQEGVWTSTISLDDLAAKCAALEADPTAKDLPLYGIPFSVKDNIDTAGFDTTAACPAFAYRPDASATVVARAEAAGAICLGKTNMDQFATGLVGVRTPYGTARNPFNPDYIPGGSSSGAGVSISTGMVAFAFGTDTGGSGRVPASYNGIYGLKPAPGAWSRHGLLYACRSFDTATVFCAALEDALTVDQIVKGHDPKDAMGQNFAEKDIPKPRIAMAPPDKIDTFGDADVAALYQQAYTLLTDALGAADADLTLFQSINDLMFFGPYLAERDVSVGAFIEANPNDCHPVVGPMIQASRKFTAADAYRAQYETAEAQHATQAFWQDHDVLITPTVGALVTRAMCEADPLGPNFRNGTYTNFANPLGLSGLAVPFGRTPQNVPWGMTLYALPERFSAAVGVARSLASLTGAGR
ncbi:aspartyl-tRNA(Asn)/glutamyl-tRNA (Gln) amidotransferase subunit A [Actibacterium atlanticum]|uniref:Aspartyl-tRNA(Asn)/glutamyl-tRNA (Gln) amidotransferase subunit A n=1 Tax=Actibacterium atlanticum TaxID=1461693 RepID=A0A058ZL83_9RHOB|nr:amidase family protein [Actibacterium atlanticum]KCV82293.1 aspartyl-tRNA(Asn)/glutamyl-tRNA (Gln) amidotransferase subunit A [Actibacterium atlanticum]